MFRVALLIETSRSVGRGLLRGIFRYARLHGEWSFHLLPGDVDLVLPAMKAWQGTGIIARVWTPALERAVVRSHLPLVAVSLSYRQRERNHPLSNVPEVVGNQTEIGRLVAEHLHAAGYRHFAFVGDPHGPDWSNDRGQAFIYYTEKLGHSPKAYWHAPGIDADDWGHEQRRLTEWVRALPKPVGIMAAVDARGQQLIEACRAAGLRIPEDVGIVGVDNDELHCELTDPPMTSVATNTEAAGYRAAEVLHRLMEGAPMRRERITIDPLNVVRRRSTEFGSSGDPAVAEAIGIIRAQSARPIQVTDVARQVGLSRRSLEQRFRKATGQTLLAEIHRARFDRVRAHLTDTRLSVTEIAQKLGFSSSSYLARFCRQHLGMPPEEWRRNHSGHL